MNNQDVVSNISPETATKKSLLPKEPKKRGRKGDKITTAFLSVSTVPVCANDFAEQHGISIAVLRQSKRFISTMDANIASQIGNIIVKQDKSTKKLMIWKEV